MMLRFGTGNFRSLRDFQEFSLIASALTDFAATPLHEPQLDHDVVAAAAIYGANASGKSNFIAAIRFLRTLVEQSYQAGKPGSPIPVTPFGLDPDLRVLPSQFDIDFIHDGVRFNFGCQVTSERVVEEHLIAYPQKRRQTWYTREGGALFFGKALKGENRSVESVCRDNSLFLSAAVASNHQQLTEVSKFFSNSLVFFDSIPHLMSRQYEKYWHDGAYKRKLVALLRAADIGISDFEIEATPPSDTDREFFQGLNELLKKLARRDDAAGPFETEDAVKDARRTIKLKHVGAKGDMALDFASESRGTQQYLNLLAPTLEVLESGSCLFVDEIDSSLHPLVSKKLVGLFQSRVSNPRGAQLVFTTHDTNLLSRELLRRDQIWFAEKDADGASCIYPLSDIKTRRNDNIERGYLGGRYGAVPFLGDFESIFSDIDGGGKANGAST